MSPLAQILSLLAMQLTVATAAVELIPLDMAKDSFDDQYKGCRPAMTEALPALNHSELQQNPLYAQAWAKAAAQWQQRRSNMVSPPLDRAKVVSEWQLMQPAAMSLPLDQAIAVVTFAMDDLHSVFNEAVSTAGRSPQEYRDNFHFKTLHFLLTQALANLRDYMGLKCYEVVHRVCGVWFQARQGDTVRFDRFMSIKDRRPGECSEKGTLLQVYTCQVMDIDFFSSNRETGGFLIPPFETFEVVQVTENGNMEEIKLRSTGTSSKYNCEWLKGGSIPVAPFHLGGFLLATTALAVATGIL